MKFNIKGADFDTVCWECVEGLSNDTFYIKGENS